MRKYIYYLLPTLICTSIILEQAGVLHIGYLYIKSHELKWTNLDYNYFPRPGDIFTAGESVSHNNYEDAILAILPDYDRMLATDLREIAQNRSHIDHIDGPNMSFYSKEYMIKVCLDKKDISINDSTIFKKLVNVEILGQYELYDREGCELLYQRHGEKFWIRDKIILRGLAGEAFIHNKIEEIWLAQMSNHAHLIISQFESPYFFRDQIKMFTALQYFSGTASEDKQEVLQRSRRLIFEFDRVERNGSRVYGHLDDPNYHVKILKEKLDREQQYFLGGY